jgi:hypothetical protein
VGSLRRGRDASEARRILVARWSAPVRGTERRQKKGGEVMECRVCGRFGAADRETGFDADGICGGCSGDGWTELASGEIVREPEIKPARVASAEVEECPF